MLQTLSNKLNKEYEELENLRYSLQERESKFQTDLESYIIDNMNTSAAHKIELFQYNTRQTYQNSYEQVRHEQEITCGIDLGSFLGRSEMRSQLYLFRDEVIEMFSEILKQDKFKTVYGYNFLVNRKTHQVKSFSSIDWKGRMRQERIDLFKDTIRMAAGSKIKEENEGEWKQRNLTGFEFRLKFKNPISSSPTKMFKTWSGMVEEYFERYPFAILHSAYCYRGGENYDTYILHIRGYV